MASGRELLDAWWVESRQSGAATKRRRLDSALPLADREEDAPQPAQTTSGEQAPQFYQVSTHVMLWLLAPA